MEHSLWNHLPLLVRANTKESVEYILQALWRTRQTGLDSADRLVIRDILQLPNDTDLDPLLVCLRMLIRRCVYENKFQTEWRADVFKDQVDFPRLKAMTWNMANQDAAEGTDPVAVISLKLQNDTQSHSEVKFQLGKDTLETMVKSMYCIRDQLSDLEVGNACLLQCLEWNGGALHVLGLGIYSLQDLTWEHNILTVMVKVLFTMGRCL
ncbi:COMM DOMAIN-CONTAINING PROTEIN 9 [Salix viminalis]|uniref:COMM DOMAIN-CONTAINING PROTEIN 9 n=1 Tax=Salix viminalis TaxID=40686 RepID=A0A9Q0SC35_SALVM|nr:COMM DOMAIN-CONTAINING PROTEIN 9 [Salix viminalis]